MTPLLNSKDCEAYLRNIWEYDTINYEERVYIVFLNTRGVRIDYKVIYDSRHATCEITPDKVLKIVQKAIKLKSKHIVIAHNHPSGCSNPSDFDIKATSDLVDVLNRLDITVIDHIILTEKNYYSFKDNGLIDNTMKPTG